MADSSNTGRNFLLVGIVLGVGAAAAGVYVLNTPEPESLDVTHIVSDSEKAAALTQEASQMKENALTERRLVDAAPPLEVAFIPRDKAKGKKVPRYTPLFFAPDIWQVPDAAQKKNVAVDLLAADSKPIHTAILPDGSSKPVPNGWFYSYGLESSICAADALQQDPDSDGFTNSEEFIAGSDPSDASSMPPFVVGSTVKIETVGDKHVQTFSLELSTASYFDENTANISVFSENGQRVLQHKELKAGDHFGLGDATSGPMDKNRFTLEKIDKSTDQDGIATYFVHLNDAYTALNDSKQFDLKAGSRNRHVVRDTSVKIRVIAGPEKGKELTVQLGQQFAVPGFKDTSCVVTDAGKKKTQVKVSVNGGPELSVSPEKTVAPSGKE